MRTEGQGGQCYGVRRGLGKTLKVMRLELGIQGCTHAPLGRQRKGRATWREGRTRAKVQRFARASGAEAGRVTRAGGQGALLATLRGTDLLQRARAALKDSQLKSDLFRLVALRHRGNRKEAGLGVGEGWRQASPAEDKLQSSKPCAPTATAARHKKEPVSALCHFFPFIGLHPPIARTLLQLYLAYPEVT